MSKEKLNNLIDKVIGKVGPLRAPAYWTNKLLKDIGEWISKTERSISAVDSKVDETKASIPTKVSQLENDSEYATADMTQQYEYKTYKENITVSPTRSLFILDVMPNNYTYWNSSRRGPCESYVYTFLNKSSSLMNPFYTNCTHVKDGNPFGLYKLSFTELVPEESFPVVCVNEMPPLNGFAYCTFDYKEEDIKIHTGNSDRSRIFYNGSYVGDQFYPQIVNGKEGEYSFLYIITSIDTEVQGKGSIIYTNTIGDKVKKIELCNTSILYTRAFAYKSLLEEIVFPTTLHTISNNAFEGCTSLKELVFNSNVKILSTDCFKGVQCPIYFNESCEIKDIGRFSNTATIPVEFQKDVIFYKDSVIEVGVMDYCKISGTLYIDTGFDGLWNSTPARFTFGRSDIEKVVIGENMSYIGGYAFAGSTIKEVHIQSLYSWMHVSRDTMNKDALFRDSVVFIEGEIPTDIRIPAGITTIKEGVFSELKSLKTVTSNGEITKISYSPFDRCENLEYIDFSNQTVVPEVEIYKTYGIAEVPHIVPDALYDEWVSATNWATISDYIIKKSDWDAQNATE